MLLLFLDVKKSLHFLWVHNENPDDNAIRTYSSRSQLDKSRSCRQSNYIPRDSFRTNESSISPGEGCCKCNARDGVDWLPSICDRSITNVKNLFRVILRLNSYWVIDVQNKYIWNTEIAYAVERNYNYNYNSHLLLLLFRFTRRIRALTCGLV